MQKANGWVFSRLVAVVLATATMFGENLSLPEWLRALPEARDITTSLSDSSIDASYVVPLAPASVVSRYEEDWRQAGITFEANGDGMGTSLRASDETTACVTRVTEANAGSRVRITCAPNPRTSAAVPIFRAEPVTPHVAAPSIIGNGNNTAADNAPLKVEYTVIGPQGSRVSITFRNASGETEQRDVPAYFDLTLYATRGTFLYLSAQKKSQVGVVQVLVRISGLVVYQGTSSAPYGIATASGNIPANFPRII
jgi:hypothetical protein